MCDPAQIPYKPDDIVWVKLSNVWWPAQVQDPDKLEKEVTEGLKKTPLVIVKFFNEDSYEYIRNLDQIYHYNCTKKVEFLQKGLDLCRPNINRSRPSSMGKFPDDIRLAEEISGGNPDICNDPMFKHDTDEKKSTASPVKQTIPEFKTPKTTVKRVRTESSASPPKKRNRNSLPATFAHESNLHNVESTPVASSSKTEEPATVPRRRRKSAKALNADSTLTSSLIHQDLSPAAFRRVKPEIIEKIKKKNYQANIRIQPSPSPSVATVQEYICYRCNDKTNRLSRLIEHYRAHDKHGMNVPPMSPMITITPLAISNPGPSTVDSLSTPKIRKEKPKARSKKSTNETPAKKKTITKEETPKSEPIKKIDIETSSSSKKKLKKKLKSKTVEADRNKFLRENILKDWDESDDESANDSKVFNTTAEVHFPASRQTESGHSVSLSETLEPVDSDQNHTTENTTTSSPSTLATSNTEASSVKDDDSIKENIKKKADKSPEIPIASENKGEEEKSCFDFEEDLEDAINLDKSHKFGQKLPRVINEEKLNKTINSDAHKIVKSEEDNKILENKIEELLESTKILEVPKIPDISSLPKRRSTRIRGRRNVSFIHSDEDMVSVSRHEERSVTTEQTTKSSKDEKFDVKNDEPSVREDLKNSNTGETVNDDRIPAIEQHTNNSSEIIEETKVLEKSNDEIDSSLDRKTLEESTLETVNNVSMKEVENTEATDKTCELTDSKDENNSADMGNLQEDEEKYKIDVEDEYIEVVSPNEYKGQLIEEKNYDNESMNLSTKEYQDEKVTCANQDNINSTAVEESMKKSQLIEDKEIKEQTKANLMDLSRKEEDKERMESEKSKEKILGSKESEEEKKPRRKQELKVKEEDRMEFDESKDNLMDLSVKQKKVLKKSEENKEILMDLSVKEEVIKESDKQKEKLYDFPQNYEEMAMKSNEESQDLAGKQTEEIESIHNKEKFIDLKEKDEVKIEEKLLDFPSKKEAAAEVLESEYNKERIMDLSVKVEDLMKSKENKENLIKSRSIIMDLSVKEVEEDLLMEPKENKEHLIESKGVIMDLSVKEEDLFESKENQEASKETKHTDVSKDNINTAEEQTITDVCDKCPSVEEPQIAEEYVAVDKKLTGEVDETLDITSSITIEKIGKKVSPPLASDEEVLLNTSEMSVDKDNHDGILSHNKIEMMNSSDSDVNSNAVIPLKEDIIVKNMTDKLTEKIKHDVDFCREVPKDIESVVDVGSNEESIKYVSSEDGMERSKDNLKENENKMEELITEEQQELSSSKTISVEEAAQESSFESEQTIIDDKRKDENNDISGESNEADLINNDLSSKEVTDERSSEVNNEKLTKNSSSSEQPPRTKNDKHYQMLEIGNYNNEMSSEIHQWTAMEYYADLEAQVRNDFNDDETKTDSDFTKPSYTSQTEVAADTQSKSELVHVASSNNMIDEDIKSKNIDNSQVNVEIKEEMNDSPSKTTDSNRSRVIYDFKLDFPEHTVNEIPPKLTKSKKRKWETKEPDDKLRENDTVNKHFDKVMYEKTEQLTKEVQQSKQLKTELKKTCEAGNLESHCKKLKLDIGELIETNVCGDERECNIRPPAEVRDEIIISNEPEEMKEIIIRSEDTVQPIVCHEISSTPLQSVEVNQETVPAETISVISCISKKEETLSDSNMQLNFTTIALNSATDKKDGITPFDASQLELDINSMPVVIEEDLIQDIKLPTVTSVACSSSSSSRSNHKQIRIQLRKAGENTSSLLQGAQNGKIIRIPGTSKEPPTVTKKVQLPSTSKVQTPTTIQSQRAIASAANQPAVMLKVPIQGTAQAKYALSKNQIRATALAPAGTSGHPVKLQIIPQGPHQSAKLVMQTQQKPFASKLAPRVVIKNQSGALGVVSNKQLTMTVKPGQKVNINQKRIISGKNIITKTSTIAVSKTGAVATPKNAKSIVVTKPGGISVQTAKTVLPAAAVQGTSVASAVQVVSQSVPSKVIMRRGGKSSSGASATSATASIGGSVKTQKGAIFIQTSQGLVQASKTVTKQIMQQMQPQFAAAAAAAGSLSAAQRPSQSTTTNSSVSNLKRVPVNKSRQANVNILKGNQKKVNRQQVALHSQQGQLSAQHSKQQQVLSIPATSISSHELILNTHVPLQLQNIATAQSGDVKMLYLVDDRGQYHQVDNSPLIAIDNSGGDNKNVFIESNSSAEVDNFLLAFGDTGVNVSTATSTTPSQDILAKALANTQVLQSDSTDISDTLEGATLYVEPQFPAQQPTLAHNVLETSFSLNPPIMTPLEVPSSVSPQVTSIASALIPPTSTVDTIVHLNKKTDAQPSMPLLTDDVEVGQTGQTVYIDSSGLVSATSSSSSAQPLTFQVINSDGNIVASSDEILQKRLLRDDLNETNKQSNDNNQSETVCPTADKSISSFTFSSQTSTTDNETKFIVEEKR